MGRAGEAFVEISAKNKTAEGLKQVEKFAGDSGNRAGKNFIDQFNEQTKKATFSAQGRLNVSGLMPNFGAATLSKYALGGVGIGAAAGGASLAGAAVATMKATSSAISKFADFESVLNQIGAIGGFASDSMRALSETIRQTAASSIFTTKEVAEAALSLTKAGFTANDVQNLTPSVTNLAVANSASTAYSADVLGAIMRAMGIDSSKGGEVADLLTVATTGSAQGIEDLGEALKYIAPNAKMAGLSLKETLSALMGLANKGLKGTAAATQLSNAILRPLTDAKAQKELNKLGIATLDDSGNMRAIEEIAQDLRDAMGNLDKAQQAAITKRVYGKQGLLAGALDENDYNANMALLNGAQGKAQEIADARLQGLSGTIEKVKSTFDSFLTTVGEKLSPNIQAVLTEFSEKLPDVLQKLLPRIEDLALALPNLTEIFTDNADTIAATVGKYIDTLTKLAQIPWRDILQETFKGASSAFDGVLESANALFDVFATGKSYLTAFISALSSASSSLQQVTKGQWLRSFLDSFKATDENLINKARGSGNYNELNQIAGAMDNLRNGKALSNQEAETLLRMSFRARNNGNNDLQNALTKLLDLNQRLSGLQQEADANTKRLEQNAQQDNQTKSAILSSVNETKDNIKELIDKSFAESETKAKDRKDDLLEKTRQVELENDLAEWTAELDAKEEDKLNKEKEVNAKAVQDLQDNFEQFNDAAGNDLNNIVASFSANYSEAVDRLARSGSPLAKGLQAAKSSVSIASGRLSDSLSIGALMNSGAQGIFNYLGLNESGLIHNPQINSGFFAPQVDYSETLTSGVYLEQTNKTNDLLSRQNETLKTIAENSEREEEAIEIK